MRLLGYYLLLAGVSILAGVSSLPLYPTFGLLILSAAIPAILVGLYSPPQSMRGSANLVFGLVVFSMSHRIGMTLRPASMVGYDPDKYAVFSNLIVESGSIPDLGFYGFASLFHLLPAMLSVLFDIPPRLSYLIYAIIFGATPPIMSWIIARRLTTRGGAAIGAGLGSALPSFVHFSIWPISQALGTVFFVFALYSFGRAINVQNDQNRWVILMLMYTLAGGLAHKLPVLMLALVMVFAKAIVYITQNKGFSNAT
ncbi:hypothetical protein [Halorussus salinus]|uniref:hypothetical protein n=1 Tax=Halorussus salinus TaxID=1364935 RepID=UPI0010919444|nr:hypothetical protein [Halorussus salinus]